MENYQKKLENIINENKSSKPTLLLHACCAPCSSYVLFYLHDYFDITVSFYNPNISLKEEYQRRLDELKRFIYESKLDIKLIYDEYDSKAFYEAVNGLEHLGEKSKRCYKCYLLRLRDTAIKAKELGMDYFTTTLSISPHKNSMWINEIQETLEHTYKVKALPSDFKKNDGYKKSIAYSKEYSLYRQDYCGCIYSKKEMEEWKKSKMQ